MKDVQVYGRFVDHAGHPVTGTCEFVPSRVWLDEGENSYPVPAPLVELDEGRVLVELVRTDQHDISWYYTVISPAGTFAMRVEDDGPLRLRDLMALYA